MAVPFSYDKLKCMKTPEAVRPGLGIATEKHVFMPFYFLGVR